MILICRFARPLCEDQGRNGWGMEFRDALGLTHLNDKTQSGAACENVHFSEARPRSLAGWNYD